MPSSPLRPHCGHTLSRVWFDVPLFSRPFVHQLRGVVVGVDVVAVTVMVALEGAMDDEEKGRLSDSL
ncbi:hypothetical protein Scep_026318 [Stephania cephalantha]|uniref:Uncharacterized protein n=1 Tax=Stephania cephalantha TaxID=152367 RepID=A0AAP0EKB2_9MAGN